MGNTHSVVPETITRPEPRDVPAVGTPNVNPDFPDPVTEEEVGVYEQAAKVAESNAAANKIEKYARFRTEMMAYMLGEAAYDYAEKLYTKHPDDPNVMGFLTETIWLYEKTKLERKRSHWLDRMDIMERGIQVARRCIRDHPDFTPCYRNYTMIALRMADQKYFWRWMRSMGCVENYDGIMKRGLQTLEKEPDFDVAMGLAELNARAGLFWYSPYKPYAMMYGIPAKEEMLERSVELHKLAQEINPNSLENTCRLAMVCFEQGKMNEARKWYVKVRDGMVANDPKEEVWQSIAHTHLSMRFQKTRWNSTV